MSPGARKMMRKFMKQTAITVGAFTAAILISACQIQPLHSTAPQSIARNDGIPAALRSIRITDPKSRFDQLVRNELQFALAGGTDATGELPYTLTLDSTKSVRSVGISDIDFGPRAFFISITANYVLKDARLAAPIAQGAQEGTASYDRVDQEFANIRSERDAEIRAAKAAALRIRHALTLALSQTR